MSNDCLRWAWLVPINGVNKNVLVALADHADENAQCYPSVARLVLFTGWKERSVRIALRELEAAGLIRTGASRGRATNTYVLSMDPACHAPLAAREEETNPAPHAGKEPANPAPHAPQPGTSYRNPASHAPNPARGAPNPAPHAPEPPLTTKEPPEEPPPNPGARPRPPPLELVAPSPKKKPGSEDQSGEAIEIWNLVCGAIGNGIVTKITDARRSAVRARLREDFQSDLAQWRRYCEEICLSEFLTGGGEKNWRADFDWAVRPGNLVKVREGKYANREARAPPRKNTDLARRLMEVDMDGGDEPPPLDSTDFDIDLDPGDFHET